MYHHDGVYIDIYTFATNIINILKLKYPHNVQFRDKECLACAIFYDQLDCFKYLIDHKDKFDYKS
jgi:hypothetical protein